MSRPNADTQQVDEDKWMLFEEQANIVVVALTLLIIIVVLYKLEMTLLISHVVLFLCLWAYCTSFSFRFQSRMQTRLIERPRLLMASSRPGSGGATKLDKKICSCLVSITPAFRHSLIANFSVCSAAFHQQLRRSRRTGKKLKRIGGLFFTTIMFTQSNKSVRFCLR